MLETGMLLNSGLPHAITAFLGTSGATVSNLVTPVPMGTALDLIDSDVANYIMANQDTISRTLYVFLGTRSLNSTSANNAYILSAIFMLVFNYGLPTVYSGFISISPPFYAC